MFTNNTTTTHNRTSSACQDARPAQVNPFTLNLNANPFSMSVNPREFVPTATTSSFASSMSSKTFVPTVESSSQSFEGNTHSDDKKQDGAKYKTELCKNWIEVGTCRYGKKCQFAHGKEEQEAHKTAEDNRRTKNCRTFYKTNQCMYGSRCMFRHEHRHINQIHRHYYWAKLYTYESLFQYHQDQNQFISGHESGVPKLSIFSKIHAEGTEEEAQASIIESASFAEDDSLSFIDLEEEIYAFCDPDVKSPAECELE